MKRNSFALSILAIILILCTAVSPALAYFTAHDRADGAVPITLSGKTEIQDDYKDYLKTVSIENTEGRPVWIRMRIVAGVTYRNNLVITPGIGWSDGGDGYWYYGSPVLEHGSTSNMTVDISQIPTTDLDLSETQFNVAILYESTPVQYNPDGTTKAPNWDIILDSSESVPSGSGSDGGADNG